MSGGRPPKPVPVEDAPDLDAYKRWLLDRGMKPEPVRLYLAPVRLMSEYVGKPLREVDAADLQRWRETVVARLKFGTQQGYVQRVKAFFHWAAEAGIVPVDPAASLPMPRMRDVPRRLSGTMENTPAQVSRPETPRRARATSEPAALEHYIREHIPPEVVLILTDSLPRNGRHLALFDDFDALAISMEAWESGRIDEQFSRIGVRVQVHLEGHPLPRRIRCWKCLGRR